LPRVFLSYTRIDRDFADRLAADLTRAGIDVWYDNWEIRPGDSIVEKIDEALTANDHLLIVLSPAAVESTWVRRELNSTIMRNLHLRQRGLIPILRTPCEVPAIINDIHYVDFTTSYNLGFDELISKFAEIPRVPAYSSHPRSITEVDLTNPTGPVRTLFPKTFHDWPGCMLDDSKSRLDVTIVVGSTARERTDESGQFGTSPASFNVFGTTWRITRQVSPGTVRDLLRVADLTAYLSTVRVRDDRNDLSAQDVGADALCLVDLSVSRESLEKNLILVGAGDTNLWFAVATVAYRQRFGFSIPIRYSGDDSLYFTCDQIYSELSGQFYPRLEESGYMHCGYLAMVPNPWAPDKVMVLASGTRATGTQAALLALIRGTDNARADATAERWHSLSANNRYHAGVPAKIVRATKAEVIAGSELIGGPTDQEISPYARVSRRHVITDFEFLE